MSKPQANTPRATVNIIQAVDTQFAPKCASLGYCLFFAIFAIFCSLPRRRLREGGAIQFVCLPFAALRHARIPSLQRFA